MKGTTLNWEIEAITHDGTEYKAKELEGKHAFIPNSIIKTMEINVGTMLKLMEKDEMEGMSYLLDKLTGNAHKLWENANTYTTYLEVMFGIPKAVAEKLTALQQYQSVMIAVKKVMPI